MLLYDLSSSSCNVYSSRAYSCVLLDTIFFTVWASLIRSGILNEANANHDFFFRLAGKIMDDGLPVHPQLWCWSYTKSYSGSKLIRPLFKSKYKIYNLLKFNVHQNKFPQYVFCLKKQTKQQQHECHVFKIFEGLYSVYYCNVFRCRAELVSLIVFFSPVRPPILCSPQLLMDLQLYCDSSNQGNKAKQSNS